MATSEAHIKSIRYLAAEIIAILDTVDPSQLPNEEWKRIDSLLDDTLTTIEESF